MSFLKKFFGPPDIEKLKANRDHLKLLDVLRNQMDPTLRQKAAEALVDIGCGREAVEVLRAMGNALAIDPLFVIIAKEKNSRVRLSAQQALRKINHPRVSRYFLPSFGSVESNVKHLNDPDEEKRFIAARALGMQGDKRALRVLISALRGKNVIRAAEAAEVLGEMKAKEAISPLITALQYKFTVCRAAAKALKAITGQDFGNNAFEWDQWYKKQRGKV